MSNVRQMPKIYLRGAAANITMKRQTPEQRAHLNALVKQTIVLPSILEHRHTFAKKLRTTIRSDYRDDRRAIDQDFAIAVYHCLSDLFYHHAYTYRCSVCGSSTYHTKGNRLKVIDHITEACPNCDKVIVVNPGCITTLRPELALTIQEFQDSYRDMPDGHQAPTRRSPIVAIQGDKKHKDPQAVFDDKSQLNKLVREYVLNYARQQLKENKRTEHRVKHYLTGPTDYLLTQELLELCAAMDIKHHYCAKTEPQNGCYTIRLIDYDSWLETSPEFTGEFVNFHAKALLYGVPIVITPQTIEIVLSPDATPLPTRYRIVQTIKDGRTVKIKTPYQTTVIKSEFISVIDNFPRVTNEQENNSAIDQVSHRTIGGSRVDPENHVRTIATSEVLATIRGTLPDGHCQAVFDIYCQQGEIWDRFATHHGPNPARTAHLAAFLGTTTKAIERHQQTIRTLCSWNGLGPILTKPL